VNPSSCRIALGCSVALLAALTALTAVPADARELGRLFFTPEQRAALERNRFAPPPKEAPKPAPRVEAPPPGVALNGVVTRSSGHSTTWVNGVARHDAPGVGPTTTRVPIAERRQSVPLKVGESYDPGSGARSDVLGGGSIRVTRGD
jgi:hypothetical protein